MPGAPGDARRAVVGLSSGTASSNIITAVALTHWHCPVSRRPRYHGVIGGRGGQ